MFSSNSNRPVYIIYQHYTVFLVCTVENNKIYRKYHEILLVINLYDTNEPTLPRPKDNG